LCAEGIFNDTVVLLSVCAEDGSVQVATNGVELGQGLNTKVAATLAYELSTALNLPLDISQFRVGAAATDRVANGSQTGGSTTSEACCAAAILAASALTARLKPVLAANPKLDSWQALVTFAAANCVDLQVSSQYALPNPPNDSQFTYYVFAAACSQVEIDVLTGEVHILSVDIVYDCGNSLSPLVDIGQIEGEDKEHAGRADMMRPVRWLTLANCRCSCPWLDAQAAS